MASAVLPSGSQCAAAAAVAAAAAPPGLRLRLLLLLLSAAALIPTGDTLLDLGMLRSASFRFRGCQLG
ncbi:Cadm1 [Phodopus roborovskii]|uniref:Cadm1 protein n=1 Tax=Phodopus roborovskii TaxID=109678 RepID=A0AAU9ZU57_PHORO|nr:Cadm1 [Phodopus roborovskii]